MSSAALLMTLELKLPGRPRSAVMTISSGRWPNCSCNKTCRAASVRVARLLNTRSISCAYGRLRKIRSCARRSLDDETIFMAFVICCVDLTARTRRRMSMSDGMVTVKNEELRTTTPELASFDVFGSCSQFFVLSSSFLVLTTGRRAAHGGELLG